MLTFLRLSDSIREMEVANLRQMNEINNAREVKDRKGQQRSELLRTYVSDYVGGSQPPNPRWFHTEP